jgi:hypothetical protein
MAIDKIKEILPTEVYQHWIKCNDIQKMQDALKELRWMLNNRKELLLTGDLVNRYYAEIELLQKRTSSITSSEYRLL